MLAVNTDGEILLISLISQTVLHRLRTNRLVADVQFSPDGRYFAVAKESLALIYRAPGPQNHEFNPWGLERVLKGAFDDTTCLSWSPCSRVVAVGAKDNTTRIYAIQKFNNFKVYCLGGHSDPIVRVFLDKESKVYTLSRSVIIFHVIKWSLQEGCFYLFYGRDCVTRIGVDYFTITRQKRNTLKKCPNAQNVRNPRQISRKRT